MRLRLLGAASALVLAAVVAIAAPGRSVASTTEQSILMDDQPLLYTSDASALAALQRIKDLGVNVVKVSMVWALVAPSPNSSTAPSFNAADPGSYPAHAWDRYDRLVQIAQQLGLSVFFELTGPAPAWAVGHDPSSSDGSNGWSYQPNPAMFKQFVEAVATRYSGDYTPPPPPANCTTTSGNGFTITTPGGLTLPVGNPSSTTCQQPVASGPLPAVRWWSIWNEPNWPGWLSPQTRDYNGRRVLYAPALYRRLADAGYSALLATGHADDTILLGETAPGVNDAKDPPLTFVRDVYCVSASFRPLSGTAATALGCPGSGDRSSFVTSNPGLFGATGWAHHPYYFDHAPNARPKQAYNITLEDLGALGSTLDRAFRAYGEPTGLPLYLTEWGYKTNPPSPFNHTSLTQQADWLNEGEYMTYFMPRVRALSQFLLYDLPPDSRYPAGTAKYWEPFASGLLFINGEPKPSYAAFRLPLWIPNPRHGKHVAVWAQLRPGGAGQASLQWESGVAGSRWSSLATLSTSNSRGFLLSHVAIPRGVVRIAYRDRLAGATVYSRSIVIH